jgi:AcrR family transcriptional regulator
MPRKYELKRRAELKEQTRQRIVDAADELHRTVGFVDASISAVADRAGVQRLTVYRHFPDERALVGACAVNFFTKHPLPDPAPWRAVRNPEERLGLALTEIYAYFGRVEGNLANFIRDSTVKPWLAELGAPLFEHWAQMQKVLATGWGAKGARRSLIVAGVALAIDFGTWRALVRRQGLEDEQAVEMMVGLVRCI